MSTQNVRPAVGERVRVTQQIPQRHEVWTTHVEGKVLSLSQKKTGSWYAHSKDDRLWLDRLTLQKDDGERVVCILDDYSHLEVLPQPEEAAAASIDDDGLDGDEADQGSDDAASDQADDAQADEPQAG